MDIVLGIFLLATIAYLLFSIRSWYNIENPVYEETHDGSLHPVSDKIRSL